MAGWLIRRQVVRKMGKDNSKLNSKLNKWPALACTCKTGCLMHLKLLMHLKPMTSPHCNGYWKDQKSKEGLQIQYQRACCVSAIQRRVQVTDNLTRPWTHVQV